MKMFYEKDTDINLIKDKKIAIFGYEPRSCARFKFKRQWS